MDPQATQMNEAFPVGVVKLWASWIALDLPLEDYLSGPAAEVIFDLHQELAKVLHGQSAASKYHGCPYATAKTALRARDSFQALARRLGGLHQRTASVYESQ